MSAPEPGPHVCYIHPDREAYIQCQRCERYICPADMNAAAVGFQCPNCVRDGNATVRQPRTTAGGAIAANTAQITTAIIAINVAVYALTYFTGDRMRDWLFGYGAMWGVGVAVNDQYWRLLTAAFLHAPPPEGFLHIGFNMYALYIFGPFIEQALGRWRFITSYITLAVASSVFVYWLSDPRVPTIGASGAVFGLFGLALVFLIRAKQNISGMLVLLAINGAISLTSNVSWQGHLGGFVMGILLGLLFAYGPRRSNVHAAAFVLTWVAIIAAVAVRTATLLS